MRTTVTIDPELFARIEELRHRHRATFKDTLDRLLRRGLAAEEAGGAPPQPFRVEVHDGGFRPGVDPGRLNQLADQIEVAEFFAAARREP